MTNNHLKLNQFTTLFFTSICNPIHAQTTPKGSLYLYPEAGGFDDDVIVFPNSTIIKKHFDKVIVIANGSSEPTKVQNATAYARYWKENLNKTWAHDKVLKLKQETKLQIP